MSDERLSDDQVAHYAHPNRDWPANALAREVQELRYLRDNVLPNTSEELGMAMAYSEPIADLCARHGITVEGIVALVDETFRMITEPEHADITEAVEAGLNHDDMYYAGWEVGYHDAVTAARRLARGEEA